MKIFYIFLLFHFSINPLIGQNEMTLIGHWSEPSIDSLDTYFKYNEIWGIAMGGHEYAIIGSRDGTHFIDVTDPHNPIEVYYIDGKVKAVHRDYHDYNGYLYIVSNEGGGLQIVDLHYLPDFPPVIYDSNELIKESHNIFIDSAKAKLYHSGGLNEGVVTIYDISVPYDPIEIGSFKDFGGFTIPFGHDLFVKNDTAYINCESAMAIVDFSDDMANTLTVLNPEDYPQPGYNHSGWLSPDGNTYVMADETEGSDVKIFDVSQLPEINLLTTIHPNTDTIHFPHNPLINGDILYVSYYWEGLQVWDISNPAVPELTHSFIPEKDPLTWGVYPFLPSGNILISDIKTGLYILEGIANVLTIDDEATIIDNFIGIYPNPVSDQLVLEWNTKNEVESIYNIYDVNGKLIQNGILSYQSSKIISLNENFQKGIYILEVFGKNGNHHLKFMKL